MRVQNYFDRTLNQIAITSKCTFEAQRQQVVPRHYPLVHLLAKQQPQVSTLTPSSTVQRQLYLKQPIFTKHTQQVPTNCIHLTKL